MKSKIFTAIWISLLTISIKAQVDVLYLTLEDLDQYDRINISESDQWRFTSDLQVLWSNGELKAAIFHN